MKSEIGDEHAPSSLTSPKVSFDDEPLILIDEQDRILGYGAKNEIHRGCGALHRAFSVFLFDSGGGLLLQRRSAQKLLWPGYWSNSCCSHPRRGESTLEAAQRRTMEELGVETNLEFVYRFQYQARYGDLGTEHELCCVYFARSDRSLTVNENEIADTRWIQVDKLTSELLYDSSAYTPWLSMEWRCLTHDHADIVARYGKSGSSSTGTTEV